MSSENFVLTTFFTLIYFNIARFIGWTFIAKTAFWNRLINDNLHHYQLGILLILICLLLHEKKENWRYFLLAIGSGMVIDESMYLFYPFNKNFSHYSIIGIAFEFLVFLVFSAIILKLKKQ